MNDGVIVRASEYAESVASATGILGSQFMVSDGAPVLRVTVALSSAVVFQMTMNDGATTVTVDLNGGTALTADALYTFTFGARPGYNYNFQTVGATTVRLLFVEEVSGRVT